MVTRVPALRRLTRKLLASGSAVGDRRGGGRLLAARVERLIAMGDLLSAKMLVDQLPAIASDSQLARLAAEVALLTADEEAACRLANAIGATSGVSIQ